MAVFPESEQSKVRFPMRAGDWREPRGSQPTGSRTVFYTASIKIPTTASTRRMAFMYLCTCKSVSDHQIRQAVAQGARGFGDLIARFGVGIECGKCVDGINALLQECLNAVAPPVPVPAEATPAPIPATATPATTLKEVAPARAWFAIDL
jgi:bacterioferritin-associated ferredoxin